MLYRVVARNAEGIVVQESDLHSREELPVICEEYAGRDDVSTVDVVDETHPSSF